MKIGLIGIGMVGGALRKWLTEFTDHELFIFDPDKGHQDSMEDCDAVFISVPAWTKKSGSQDLSIIVESIRRCPKESEIYIRSTVLPYTCSEFRKEYDRNVIACPEFLTARTAYADMKSLPILCGNESKLAENIFPGKEIIRMKNAECEMVKYAHNCLGAVKVAYCNLVKAHCDELGLDYNIVKNGMLISGYINDVHTSVPGPDGRLGFGGTCFPKDLKAFAYFLEEKNFLHNVVKYNETLRDDLRY